MGNPGYHRDPCVTKAGGAQERDKDNSGGGGGGEPPRIDPIIQGLLSRLPKAGDVWPEAERKLWLELLSGSFKLIYRDKDETSRQPSVIS